MKTDASVDYILVRIWREEAAPATGKDLKKILTMRASERASVVGVGLRSVSCKPSISSSRHTEYEGRCVQAFDTKRERATGRGEQCD